MQHLEKYMRLQQVKRMAKLIALAFPILLVLSCNTTRNASSVERIIDKEKPGYLTFMAGGCIEPCAKRILTVSLICLVALGLDITPALAKKKHS